MAEKSSSPSPSQMPAPHETFDSNTRSKNTKTPASKPTGPSDSGLKPRGK